MKIRVKYFKSSLVNEENYLLCGGFKCDDEDKKIVKRLINHQKPFGNFSYFYDTDSLESIKYIHKILKEQDQLVVEKIKVTRDYIRFSACQKGTLSELFDIDSLIKDYKINDLEEVVEDIFKKKNNILKDYFKDWDYGDKESGIEIWETGLILGYPIQLTMQIYLYGGISFNLTNKRREYLQIPETL